VWRRKPYCLAGPKYFGEIGRRRRRRRRRSFTIKMLTRRSRALTTSPSHSKNTTSPSHSSLVVSCRIYDNTNIYKIE
jgi:hypothetical protein